MLPVSKFFENLHYIFIKLRHDLSIQTCNNYTISATECEESNLIGSSVCGRFHPDDREYVRNVLMHSRHYNGTIHTHRWRKKDDSYLWLKWQIVDSPDDSSIFMMGEDVSQQKRIACALKVIEETTDTGYWEIDLDTRFLYWSNCVHRIHETDASNFNPRQEDGVNFYHEDAIPVLQDGLDELERTGKPYDLDLKFISAKGKDKIVNARGFAESENGSVIRHFGTFKDLTKQKQDEITRQSLEQRIVLALRAANIGVWEYDMPKDELTWDERMFEVYDRRKESFDGKLADWLSSLHHDDVKDAISAFEHSIKNHTYFNHKFRVVAENGDIKHLHGMAAFIYDTNDNPIKATGVNIDLTESVRINEELNRSISDATLNANLAKQLAEKAKAADVQKSTFLANMSHEIRTPISGVIGLVDMMLQDKEGKEQSAQERHHYLQLVRNSSQHLLNVLSDILDFSKVEAGKISIEQQSFNLQDLLQDVIEDYRYQAINKNLSFDYQEHNIFNRKLIGDPHRLKQIFYNLLGNALKYTPSGSIKVRSRLNIVNKKQVNFIFTVIDTGIGIDGKCLDRLFLPFEQLDTSSTRKVQGTGLGLSITQKLIDLMHGSISVESNLGAGSVFTIKLPLILCDVTEQRMQNESINTDKVELLQLQNCHVLVAEDNHINQVVVQNLLTQLSIKSTLVNDGEQALHLLQSSPANTFQLILMDCQMPLVDGYKATGTVRTDQRFEKIKDIPIVALTANALSGDKAKCLQAGMDDYLTKPVNKERLSSMLLKHLA